MYLLEWFSTLRFTSFRLSLRDRTTATITPGKQAALRPSATLGFAQIFFPLRSRKTSYIPNVVGHCKNIDRPKTFIIKKAIENYINEYSDYEIALERYNDKDDKIISSSELKKDLGL